MKVSDLEQDELAMVSQYIQNQQEVINDLMQKNMQLTTEIQVLRLSVKQHVKLNKETITTKRRLGAFKQERNGLLNDVLKK